MTDIIFRIIGKKWTLPIIQKLTEFEELRFNEMKNQLEEITPSNLSITLKEMEKNNIISKKIYDADLQNFSYLLTNYGKLIYQTSILISTLGKKASKNFNNHHTLKISDKIIQEIKQLKTSDIIEEKEIHDLSRTIEALIRHGIDNVRNSTTKYLVPIGTICGVLSGFCVHHGIEHLEHIDSVM